MNRKILTRAELEIKLAEAEALIASLRNVDLETLKAERDSARDERDISRHMRDTALVGSNDMENAYIESEQNFRNSLDACPLGVRILTEDDELIYANRAILDIYGYRSVEELKAVPAEQLYTPESYAAHLDRREKRKRGEALPSEYEILIRRSDGTVRNLQVFRKEIIWGGERQFMAMYRDVTERKLVEKALIESEERYRNLVEHGNDGIIFIQNGRISYTNSKMLEISGYTTEELTGKPFLDFITPEQRERATQIYDGRVESEKAPARYELTLLAKGGKKVYVEISASLFRYKGEKADMAIVRDISERKRAEEALQFASLYTRSLIEASLYPMVTISRDGKITDVNKATEEVTGVSRERLIGSDFSNYFSEPEKAREGYKKVLSEGLVKDYELTIQHVSGRKKQVLYNASVYRDEAGEVQGIYVAARDITEHKKAKETLYHNEERFRRIFQEGLLGVALSNMNHTFAMANARFCNMFGYSVEELRAMTFNDITLPEDISSDAPYFHKLITGELKYYSTEKRYLTKNKDIIWGSLTVTLLRDNSGESQGFLSTVEDITQHKKMEEKLADSETRYRRLFETAQDAILILNGDTGKIIDANPFIKDLLGYPMKELLGKNLWEIGHLKDTLASKISNQQLQENGYVRYDHLPLLTKDGRQIAVEVVANAYQVNHSRVIQCNIRDITERKKMEESIRYHASLIENVSDAIISSDRQQKLLSWNKAAEAIYGWRADEVIGKTVNEVTKPVLQNFTPEEYQASLRQDGHWKGEAVHHRKDGGEFYVLMSVSLIRDEYGNETGAVSILKDITESKQAEERINHLKLSLRSIRNVDKHLTKEKNRDRLIQSVCDSLVESHSFNSSWIVLLDDTQKPIAWAAANPSSNFTAFIESVQRGDFPRCVQKALHQKQVVITENPGTMCPGCPILKGENENGSMTTRLEIDGTVYGVLCASMQRSLLSDKDETALFAEVATDLAFALRDIELESAYEIMEQERLRAAKLESIGTLAGGIAHDFNNLLTGIMGNIGLAKISIQPPNPVFEMLEEAEKAAVRARDLTQQLLTFARGGKPVKKLVNIGALIKESAEFSLRGSNVKLELALPNDLWSVEADEGQIGQVINNLVINANEAMPSGGTLRIIASNLLMERARGLPFPRNNYVLIDIMDSGKGIPQEYLPRIFEPYFTTKQRGSGLGLTTAYSIVRNHGGYILAESQSEKGSTFHIYLPASKKAVKGGMKMTTPNSGQEGGKVLVMDDEEIIRNMLKNILRLAGYRVELSSDGKEAIQKYSQATTAGDPFDAVIMDLTIPGGKGGKEAVKELLKIDPRAAVIVSSGYANDPIMADYKKHGFKAVIAKPYSVKQLQETLSGLPRRKKLTPDS